MSGFLVRLAVHTGVWLLALGDVSPGDLIVGLFVSAGVLWLLGYHRSDRTPEGFPGRVLRFWPFLLAAGREIVVGTRDVTAVVIGARPATPGYVEVPIGARTRNGIVVTGWLTTLIPGSVLIDIDDERGIMLFHVLDATEPEDFRSSLDRFYERYQRHVFP